MAATRRDLKETMVALRFEVCCVWVHGVGRSSQREGRNQGDFVVIFTHDGHRLDPNGNPGTQGSISVCRTEPV